MGARAGSRAGVAFRCAWQDDPDTPARALLPAVQHLHQGRSPDGEVRVDLRVPRFARRDLDTDGPVTGERRPPRDVLQTPGLPPSRELRAGGGSRRRPRRGGPRQTENTQGQSILQRPRLQAEIRLPKKARMARAPLSPSAVPPTTPIATPTQPEATHNLSHTTASKISSILFVCAGFCDPTACNGAQPETSRPEYLLTGYRGFESLLLRSERRSFICKSPSRASQIALGRRAPAEVKRSRGSRSELRTDETVGEYEWLAQGRCV